MNNLTIFALCILVLPAPLGFAADWPQWGGFDARNFASDEKNLPDTFTIGRKKPSGEYDTAACRNIKWIAKLGNQTYGNPTISSGRVFVGTNGELGSRVLNDRVIRQGGAVLCFNEATGKQLWQLPIARLMTNDPMFNFDNMSLGVCSSPTVEGDRVYLVSNRCEVLCLDAATGAIVWNFDMIKQVRSWPQDAADCSILIHGDYLYVGTSNGVDRSHKNVPHPDAPMLIVLDKKTGAMVARDDANIGRKILHGQWSSPSLAKVGDRTLVFYGGGDGVCYAFDAEPQPSADGKGKALKVVWSFDVNPPERRVKNGVPVKYPSKFSASEITATPVFYKNRIYVDVGQDPRHGKGCPGMLVCIDATKTGDITQTGKIWAYDKIDRSLSTVSIVDGLLFVADFTGIVHCLDADTGKCHWTYDTQSPIWSSTFAADGRVWLGTERGELFVWAASKEMKLLNKFALDNKIYTTPIVANGVLYFTTQTHLYAVGKAGN